MLAKLSSNVVKVAIADFCPPLGLIENGLVMVPGRSEKFVLEWSVCLRHLSVSVECLKKLINV